MIKALNPVANWWAIIEFFGLINRQRALTWEMTKADFSERYAGQAFGIIWSVLHPLSLIFVYIFVFAIVFKVKLDARGLEATGDFTIYLLSGLIPWLAMQEVMSKSSQAISGNANLVKQVIFPVEVLPSKCVFAAVVTEFIFLVLLTIYMLISMQMVPWTFLLVPLLIVVQTVGMLGLGLLLSALGAYFRDSKDVIQVFCLVNIYLMPIVYLPQWVPAAMRPLMYLNPFSYQTWCFQDAIFYGRIEHPWAWLAFVTFNFLLLGVGYRSFRKLKTLFGNVL